MNRTSKIILGVSGILSLVIETVFFILWVSGSLAGIGKGIVVTLFFVILMGWVITGFVFAAILMRGEKVEEKKMAWGTEKCVAWTKMMVRFQKGEEIDPRNLNDDVSIRTSQKDRYPIFIMRFVIRHKKNKYAMIARTDEFDGRNLKHYSLIETHDQDRIDKAIEDLCPDKPKKMNVVGRKMDSLTGNTTEEVSRTEESYDDDKIELSSGSPEEKQ